VTPSVPLAAEPEEQLNLVLRDCRQIVADCKRMQAAANVQLARAEAMLGRLEVMRARIEEQAIARRRHVPDRSS